MRTLKYGKILKNTPRLTDFCLKTSLVYIACCYTMSNIIDNFVHLVVVDVNHFMCIFMNIYENLKNDRKIIGKKKVSND